MNAVSREQNGLLLMRKLMLSSHSLIRKHATFHCQSKRVKSLRKSGQWLIMDLQTVVQALAISLALHSLKKMKVAQLTQTVRQPSKNIANNIIRQGSA